MKKAFIKKLLAGLLCTSMLFVNDGMASMSYAAALTETKEETAPPEAEPEAALPETEQETVSPEAEQEAALPETEQEAVSPESEQDNTPTGEGYEELPPEADGQEPEDAEDKPMITADGDGDTTGLIDSGTIETITWKLDTAGTLTIEGSGNIVNTIQNPSPWYSHRSSIISVKLSMTDMTSTLELFASVPNLTRIDADFHNSPMITMRGMFYNCPKLTELNLQNLDTANVTDMSYMFYGCSSLTSLDLSSLDTREVTDLSSIFEGCSSLSALNLSGFNTQKVIDMSAMFRDCSSLSTLNLSSFDTQNVVGMSSMFQRCSSLASLDISHFKFENVGGTSYMFSDCSSLTSLDTRNFDTSKVINMDGMFSGCEQLKSLDVSHFDTSNAEKMNFLFLGCSNLTSLDVSGFNTQKVTGMDGMFNGCSNLSALDVTNFDTSNVTAMGSMFYGCSSLSALDVTNFNTSNVTVMSGMFNRCSSLTKLDVSHFNTAKVKYFGSMFDGCSNLTSLDLSSFVTTSAESMSDMFWGCSSLTSLDLSNFDTANVVGMGDMFKDCSGLTSLDLSNFNTQNVTGMSSMFEGCSSLASLNISNFNTANVHDMFSMNSMFSGCSSLPSLDLSSFNTANVTDMSFMFENCSSLTSLDLGSFNTANVTDMHNMFYGCSSLASLNVSSFNTGAVTDMSYMFDGCGSLISLDLGSFNTAKVKDMKAMFWECGSLISLIISSFDTSNVTNMNSLFRECSSLKSLDLSNFDTVSVTNMSYMFLKCSSLDSLDLSSFNAESASSGYMNGMFSGCDNLSRIQTPTHIRPYSSAVLLPAGDWSWYREDGTVVTELPKGLDYSITLTRKAAAQTYTVTFDLQGKGNPIPSYTNIPKGNTVSAPSAPSADGYTFTGWYKESDCKNKWDFSQDTVQGDMTLYADWTADGNEPTPKPEPDPVPTPVPDQTYTVTFDLLGQAAMSSAYPPLTDIARGSLIRRPDDPKADGYRFTGWYKEKECKNLWDFDKDTVEAHVTLYAGWAKVNGDILPGDMPSDGTVPDGLWVASVEDTAYTGKAIRPQVHVYWNNELLDEGLDYTLKYKNNTKANTLSRTDKMPSVIVTGKKHYPGQKTVYFNITPIALEEVTADDLAVAYNGKKQKKTPVLSWNGKKLANRKDFTVSYPDGEDTYQEEGDYDILVTAKEGGNFTGEKTIRLSIVNPQDYKLISKAKVSKILPQDYTAGPVELTSDELKVSFKGVGPLMEGEDYEVEYENNTAVGTATVLLRGKGDYVGTKRVTFQIRGSSMKKVSVSGLTLTKSMVYQAEELEQDTSRMELASEEGVLSEGTDYEILYSNNKNAGKAILTIQGLNRYSGIIKKSWKIMPYDLGNDPDRLIQGPETPIIEKFTGSKVKPKPQLTFRGRKLVEGRDYTISYKNNKQAGTPSDRKAPTILIKGKGNFKGTRKIEFTIVE